MMPDKDQKKGENENSVNQEENEDQREEKYPHDINLDDYELPEREEMEEEERQ